MTTFNALPKVARLALPVVAALLALLALAAAPAMAEFGMQKMVTAATNENGTPDLQAGSHPYALTNTFVLNFPAGIGGREGRPRRTHVRPEGTLRDVRLELPPGFVGNPNATPHCSYQTFIRSAEFGQPSCPNETAVGIATTYVTESGISELTATTDPVFNLVPPKGVAAEFGYIAAGVTPVFLDTSVRTGTDYGLTTNVQEISQAVLVGASKVTIWGVPASPVHNDVRGACADGILQGAEPYETPGQGLNPGEDEVEGPISDSSETNSPVTSSGECTTQTPEVPLLTNPTSCGVPRTVTEAVDSWEEQGIFHSSTGSLPPLEGCGRLDFSPTVGVTPDGVAGSTPTGLDVGVHVPQETTENPVGLAEADVRDTTVTLPAGVALSPGASDGLEACSEAQAGFTGFRELDPVVEPGVESAQFSEAAVSCPDASKVANVRIKTPLLEDELSGVGVSWRRRRTFWVSRKTRFRR